MHSRRMRVVIAGGGTGGHLFPGIAVAEELRARDPDAFVLFIGTARGIEARICPELGWPLELIEVSGIKTVGLLGAVRGVLRLPRAILQARRALQRHRPDVVLGVGGYASGPTLFAAWLGGTPTAILEQNSIPGLTNRIAGKFARRVFLAFELTRRYFRPARTTLTGTPIRAALRDRLVASAERPPGAVPQLFCFGGSLGAKAVNAIMADAADELARAGLDFTLTHQTGRDDHEPMLARYRAAGLEARVRVMPFLDDMASEYARADLVIARAGAATVAELAAVGRPAILVPYPHAADDHQAENAREFGEAGAALVLAQDALDGTRLAAAIRALVEDPDRLARMRSAMKNLGHPDAAGAIVEWLEQTATARTE